MPRTKGKQSSRKKTTSVKPKRKYTRRKKVEKRKEENEKTNFESDEPCPKFYRIKQSTNNRSTYNDHIPRER